MAPAPERLVRLVRGCARLALIWYPRAFRRTHGDAFVDAAAHQWDRERRRGASSIAAAWRAARLLVADTAAAAPAAWRTEAAARVAGSRGPGLLAAAGRWTRDFWRDLRFGARLLIRQPGFALSALLVLALGIGANTAMFGLVNALLLKPRVGGHDAALVSVHSRDRSRPDTYRAFSFAEYEELRAERGVFASLSAHTFGMVGLRDGENTRRAFADIVTADFFDTFGVRPVIGRAFTEAEARAGADIPVAILGHALWMRLGGDGTVLTRPVMLDGRAFTVVGVAPLGFGGSLAVAAPELWVPTGVYESMAYDVVSAGLGGRLADPHHRNLILVGRLHEGAPPASLASRLDVLSRNREAQAPADNRDQAIDVAPLSRISVSTAPASDAPLSGVAAFLLALSAMVLLIASFNLANMLLARGRSRRHEFAIRLAIGGSRARVVRQLLTESLFVALLGGVGGLLVSWWALRVALHSLPASLPIAIVLDPSPDARVLAATLAFALLGTIVSGLGPALWLARTNVVPDLKAQAGALTARPARRWHGLSSRDALVTAQLALTLVMLTSAGLFVKGAIEAAKSDPGFTLDRGLLVNVDTSLGGYDASRTRDVQRDVLARLRAMPGVASASIASHMPFAEFSDSRGVQRVGAPIRRGDPGADAALIEATTSSIGAGYFDTLGIPLRRGRDFTAAEEAPGPREPVAIIDETLAARLFGDADAVGQQVQLDVREDGQPPDLLRIVGVAAGLRGDLFDTAPRAFLYTPIGQDLRTNVYFHARTTMPTIEGERAMLPGLREVLRSVDPALPIVTIETRPAFRNRNLLVWIVAAGARITGVLAMAAFLVALVGVYGVKAFVVARRTREIGIRMALGARPGEIIGLVFREGLVLGGIGLAAGVGLSLIGGLLVRGLLFRGRAFDLPVVAGASIALVAASALATWLPARRALRIQPTRALREE